MIRVSGYSDTSQTSHDAGQAIATTINLNIYFELEKRPYGGSIVNESLITYSIRKSSKERNETENILLYPYRKKIISDTKIILSIPERVSAVLYPNETYQLLSARIGYNKGVVAMRCAIRNKLSRFLPVKKSNS